MSTVSVYDPRVTIRETIGTERYIQGDDRYVLTVTNNYGDSVYVPMFLPWEVHTLEPPELPYIEMKVMSSPARTMNIGGDIHHTEAFIDLDIVFVPRTHDIDLTFGIDVASELVDKIMDNRSSIGIFCEIINDGREYYEGVDDVGVVFHRIVELYTRKMQKK
jgi:hypothetical protein